MDHRGQSSHGFTQDGCAALRGEKKTEKGLLQQIEKLWREGGAVCKQERVRKRAYALALSSLVCFGRHTVTGLLTTCGRQFQDWTADYRLFSQDRFDPEQLFGAVRRGLLAELHEDDPLVVAMDDSLLRKTGTKAHGVAYRRDPLGPPFHVNFVRGQRVLQVSAAFPPASDDGPARMIPIDFRHCPTPKKPKKDASGQDRAAYRRKQKESNIGRQGADRLLALREALDRDPGGNSRALWVVVDGSFTNRNVLKNLPDRTVLIGRIRKDAKLHHLPGDQERRTYGRRKKYGDKIITPEQLRQDDSKPWQTLKVWAAGKNHRVRAKTTAPLLWRPAGPNMHLRLVVIAPLGYRPNKKSRVLYRKPAYLICTDPNVPLEKLIRAYVWRWDIEVNFRDEKTLLGVGQAQVRHPQSVENAPALTVAAYAVLLLAGAKAFGVNGMPHALPLPKWRNKEKRKRASTQDLINLLRQELWGKALSKNNFYGFVKQDNQQKKPEKCTPDIASAVLYAVA